MPSTTRDIMYSVMYTFNTAILTGVSLIPLIIAESAVAVVGGYKIEDEFSKIASLLLEHCFCLIVLGDSVGGIIVGIADGGGPDRKKIVSLWAATGLSTCQIKVHEHKGSSSTWNTLFRGKGENMTYIFQREVSLGWIQRVKIETIERVLHICWLASRCRRDYLNCIRLHGSRKNAFSALNRHCPIPIRDTEALGCSYIPSLII